MNDVTKPFWRSIADGDALRAAFQMDDPLVKFLSAALCLLALILLLSIAVAQTLAVVLILGGIVLAIRRCRAVRTTLDGFLIALIVARLLSVVLSEHLGLSIRTLYAETPFLLLFFAVTQLQPGSRRELVILMLWALIAGGVVASIYGTVGFVTGLQQRASAPGTGYYTTGTYLTAIVTLSLVAARDRAIFPRRGWWAASIAMMFIGLILTLNRVHWAILSGVLLIIGVLRERRLLAVFGVCFLLTMLLFPSVADRAAQTLHFTSHLSDRDVLWRGAATLLEDHPVFGYGPGTFRQIFPFDDLLTDKEINGWHNDYLRIYLESGLVGLTAFVVWMAAIFWKGLRYVRRKDISGSDQTIAKATFAAIGTILVSSLVASAAFDIIILMLLSLLTAIFSTQLECAPPAPTESAGQRSS